METLFGVSSKLVTCCKMRFGRHVRKDLFTRSPLEDVQGNADRNHLDACPLILFRNSSERPRHCELSQWKDASGKQMVFQIYTSNKLDAVDWRELGYHCS
jgi:hypothetical protein